MKVYKVYFKPDNNSTRQSNSEQTLPKSLFHKSASRDSAAVICGHDKNLGGYDSGGNTTYSAYYEGKLIVVYTAGGDPHFSETDIKSRRVLKIVKAVGSEGITESDWYQIYDSISGNEFLQHAIYPLKKEYSSALSILCQGYLAAHFPQPSDAPDIVKQALDLMGWTKFVETEEGKKFADFARRNAGQTEAPRWWQKVFGADNKTLLKTLHKEWGKEGLPSEILQLTKTLFGKSKISGEKKAETVAQAYLKLTGRLNGGNS